MSRKIISLIFTLTVLKYSFAVEPIVLVHGGAGTIGQGNWPLYFNGTILAARTGYNVLKNGGNVLEAVEAAIRSMEVDIIFNAGYGSVLTRKGEIEMDAMIMDGSNMKVGAVTGVQDIFHPISLAKKVMEKSEYNLLGPPGAMALARSEGFQILPPGTLETPSRRRSLDSWLQNNNLTLLSDLGGDTVGAVAIDEFGNIAAGTSTGGITGKLSGRVGDAPIVGCGTYADNNLGGISATGTGEVIMKSVLAYDILLRAKYKDESLDNAAQTACDLMLQRHRASGGVIAIGNDGEVGIGFSSNQMAWAYQKGQKVFYGVDRNQRLEMELTD